MTLPSTVKSVADAVAYCTAENASLRAQVALLSGRADVLESKVPAPIAAPVVTTPAAISSDGTPQVGEALTGVDPIGNYPVSARRWLLGSTFLTDVKGYTPQAEGAYTYEGTIAAPDGRTVVSRSTITVAAATPMPIPGVKLAARPAPEQMPPNVVDAVTDDTGVVATGSLAQFIEFQPQDKPWVAQLHVGDGTPISLQPDNASYLGVYGVPGNQYARIGGNIQVADISDWDSGLVRFAALPNGDIEIRQNNIVRATIAKATILAANPGAYDPGRTKLRLTSPVMLTNVTAGQYATVYPPLTIVSAVSLTDGTIEAVLDYYTGQNEYLDLEVFDSAMNPVVARQHATIVEYLAPGRVKVRAATTIPVGNRGAPLSLRFSLVASNRTQTTSVMWAQPMLFTINVTQPGDWYANQPVANHLALDDWRVATYSGAGVRGAVDADPQINFKGGLMEGKITKASCFIVPPRVPGQRMRLKWRGSATWALTANSPDAVARNQVTGSNATHSWIDFNFDWSPEHLIVNGSKDQQFIWAEITATGSGANWPSDYDCRPIAADGTPVSPGFWDKPYLDEIKAVMGHQVYDIARFMDCQRTVYISPIVIDRVSQPGDRTALTGVSVDDILDFCEYVGCDARINLPMQATEAMARAEARKVAKWCKRTGHRAVVEWANEVWNSGQGAWAVAVTLGRALGYTTSGHDHEIAMKYHSYGHARIMAWVTAEFVAEGVADKLTRTICVQNGNRGNQAIACESDPNALAMIDRIETAPYIASYAAVAPSSLLNTSTGVWDNNTYLARARASYRVEHDNAKYHQDYAYSKGKAYGTYEGGQEDAGDNLFHRQFQISPEAAILAKEQLDDWQLTVGGPYRWYADNRCDKYGLRVHAAQPRVTTGPLPGAPVWDAWLTKIAEIAAS